MIEAKGLAVADRVCVKRRVDCFHVLLRVCFVYSCDRKFYGNVFPGHGFVAAGERRQGAIFDDHSSLWTSLVYSVLGSQNR